MLKQILILCLTAVTGVISIQCAKYRDLFSRQPTYIECTFECCGIGTNRHCCSPAWVIVLFLFLGLAALGGMILLFYCLWKRNKNSYADKGRSAPGKYPAIRSRP